MHLHETQWPTSKGMNCVLHTPCIAPTRGTCHRVRHDQLNVQFVVGDKIAGVDAPHLGASSISVERAWQLPWAFIIQIHQIRDNVQIKA